MTYVIPQVYVLRQHYQKSWGWLSFNCVPPVVVPSVEQQFALIIKLVDISHS